MKTSILLSLGLLGLTALANPKINVDVSGQLTHKLGLAWNKVTKHEHSLKCYVTGKSDDHQDLGGENLEISHSYLKSGDLKSIGSKRFPISFGSVQTQVQKINDLEYLVSITDATSWSGYSHLDDGDCELRETHWKIHSHQISSDIAVKIKPPIGNYFIIMKADFASGIFKAQEKGLRVDGDIHNAQLSSRDSIIWFRPGSEIKINFKGSAYTDSQKTFGQFRIQFIPDSVTPEVEKLSPYLKLKEIIKQTNDIRTERDMLLKQKSTRQFLSVGHALLKSEEAMQNIISNQSLNKIKNTLDELYSIANDTTIGLGYDQPHVKAMAAAVGYRLTLVLLEDLKIFCKDVAVNLPLTGKKVTTSGLKAAYYWLNRDLIRIESLQFPEVKAFVEEFVRYENNAMKYSQLALDSKELKKINAAYVLLDRNSDIYSDLFGDFSSSLKKTEKIFGTIGANSIYTQEIYQYAGKLGQERLAVAKQLRALPQLVNRNNHEFIKASPILKDIESLEKNLNAFSQMLFDRIKFIAPDSSDDNLSTSVISLLAHQVAIFEKPLSEKFIEPIRQLFFNIAKDQKTIESFNSCLRGN